MCYGFSKCPAMSPDTIVPHPFFVLYLKHLTFLKVNSLREVDVKVLPCWQIESGAKTSEYVDLRLRPEFQNDVLYPSYDRHPMLVLSLSRGQPTEEVLNLLVQPS